MLVQQILERCKHWNGTQAIAFRLILAHESRKASIAPDRLRSLSRIFASLCKVYQ